MCASKTFVQTHINEKFIVTIDEDLSKLIPGFLENREKDIKSIKNALQKADYETIRLLGHSMKGSGGGYGFNMISEIGKSLEEAATHKNRTEIETHTNMLSLFLENVEVNYEETD